MKPWEKPMANQTRRKITRTDAAEHGADEPSSLPPELEGINPLEPHPYFHNPLSPPDYCFCGGHKSDLRHGGANAAYAPVPVRKPRTGLRSAAQVASEKAGVRDPIEDLEDEAFPEEPRITEEQFQEMREILAKQAPPRDAFDRLPIVDQALELASFLDDDSDDKRKLIQFALRSFVAYISL